MKTTVIIRDLTDSAMADLAAIGCVREKYRRLRSLAGSLPHCITFKEGNGSFRDRVEWNQAFRSNRPITYKLEPRKGYKLATFTA